MLFIIQYINTSVSALVNHIACNYSVLLCCQDYVPCWCPPPPSQVVLATCFPFFPFSIISALPSNNMYCIPYAVMEKTTLSANTSKLYLECPVQLSTRTPVILTELIHGLSQSFPSNVTQYLNQP
jgi:hypothetical protein